MISVKLTGTSNARFWLRSIAKLGVILSAKVDLSLNALVGLHLYADVISR
jgi:hypothetical protein